MGQPRAPSPSSAHPGAGSAARAAAACADLGAEGEGERQAGDGASALSHVPPVPVLTEGAEQLLLHGPGHLLHQAQRGERRKAHVVEEDDVEVPQPVEAAKIPQEVKAGDPCMTGRGSGHASPGGLPQPQPHRSSPSVLEKTGRAELSTSKDTQFPMICGVKKKGEFEGAAAQPHGPEPAPGALQRPGPCWRQGEPEGRVVPSRGDAAQCTRTRGQPRNTWGGSHLGEGGVLPLREQPGEEGGAVEAHDGGEHQVAVRGALRRGQKGRQRGWHRGQRRG